MTQTASQSHVVVNTPAGLEAIRDPDINLVIWRRPMPQVLATWLEQKLPANFKRETKGMRNVTNWPHLLDGLPSDAGLELFREDLQLQTDILADLVPTASLHLKLQVVSNNLCERFHVDSVPLRLLCTYVGPAAEWLDDADVDRSLLNTSSADTNGNRPPILSRTGQVRQLHRFDVALMKGERWPGAAGRGLVHRSPRLEVGMAKRLLFKIDFVD